MIYVFPNSTGECSIVWDENSITTEDKSRGIAIDALPEENSPEGKMAVLMGDKSTVTVWYDYADKPQELKDIQIAALQADINNLSDMLIELTTNN